LAQSSICQAASFTQEWQSREKMAGQRLGVAQCGGGDSTRYRRNTKKVEIK